MNHSIITPHPTIEIVIAHYNEDLERLKPYADQVIIYHKGNEDGPRFPVKKRVKLDNVGREAHTYLTHIVENWGNLADTTVFLMSSIHLHSTDYYKTIETYLQEVKKVGFSTAYPTLMFKEDPQINFGIDESSKYARDIRDGKFLRSPYSFTEYYKLVFKKNQPFILPVFYCAGFGVSKKLIHHHHQEFYQKLLNMGGLSQHFQPEEAHYLERLRFSIFAKKMNGYWIWRSIVSLLKDVKIAIREKGGRYCVKKVRNIIPKFH